MYFRGKRFKKKFKSLRVIFTIFENNYINESWVGIRTSIQCELIIAHWIIHFKLFLGNLKLDPQINANQLSYSELKIQYQPLYAWYGRISVKIGKFDFSFSNQKLEGDNHRKKLPPSQVKRNQVRHLKHINNLMGNGLASKNLTELKPVSSN